MPLLIIAAALILGIQIIYLIIFLVAFSKKPVPVGQLPPVSVIVCAHDEEQNLRKLVPLLLSQEYPHFELIIVEDRSNDGTYDFLLQATKLDARLKMVRVQFLPEHINGKKFAVTLGIKAAVNEWVLLTDADCIPASDQWIKSMTAHFSPAKQIVVGFSPYRKYPGYLNAFIRFESLITAMQFMGWALLGKPYMGVGRNLAYRKALFMDNKGFNRHLSVTGGDDDLFVNDHARGGNTAVSLGAETLVVSEPKKTWRQFLYQKLRHMAAGKWYKTGDKVKLGFFSMSWVLSWILVLPVMLMPGDLYLYLGIGFGLREILLIICVRKISRTLGDPFEAWKTPLLDFNYAIYYLGTGLVALMSKRVRWKI